MPPTAKPWDDVVPAEDLESFKPGHLAPDRPLQAGVRPALIVVDMTRAFVDSRYPTGFSATGYPAVEANVELLEAARKATLPVFFTKGYEEEKSEIQPVERGRWKNFGPRPQLPPGTPPGDVVVEPLTPAPGEIVVNKHGKPSGFFGTPLASYLVYEGCDTVIVSGMTTSGCVRATVLDAFQHNFFCVIPHECVADRSQLSHKVSLFDLHMKYADVISLRETVEYVDGTARGSVKTPGL